MRKRPTEIAEARFIGSPESISRLRMIAKDQGIADISDNVPWREAFPEFTENFGGTLLSGFRYREGMTQEKLSHITGIPRRHISEMENGKRPIGKETAKKLAVALKTDYRVFL
jgi:DNA-binding XRE family transcriptional regulator